MQYGTVILEIKEKREWNHHNIVKQLSSKNKIFFKLKKKKKRNKGRPFASWDVKTKVEHADLTEMMK